MATLEVDLTPGAAADDVRRAVKDRVHETTGMEHVTVEVTADMGRDG
jgi:cobalt-zinc-cadmium efflux system protein